MDERTAAQLAAIVGGEAWQSGGSLYVVTVHRDDGTLVVYSGDAICEYESEDMFDQSRASKAILVEIPEAADLFVIVDLTGTVLYLDNAMERGWRYQADAEHEARALESKGEGRFSVVRMRDLPV